jgi:hypothetical protein
MTEAGHPKATAGYIQTLYEKAIWVNLGGLWSRVVVAGDGRGA